MTDTLPGAQSPVPRSLWEHLRAWWRSRQRRPAPAPVPASEPVPALERVTESRALDEPIRVLARGDVYEFCVYAEFTWSAEGVTADTLRSRIGTYADSARDTLRGRAWAVSRTCLPHHAAEAEEKINEAVASGWCYRHGDLEIRCTPRVRATLDERVREQMLPYWQSFLETDAQHLLGQRRAEQIRKLVVIWRDLLEELTEDPARIPTVTHAARLTDSGFATVLEALVTENRSAAERLIAVLERAARTHERLGYFEFAESYDAALAGYKRQMRLPGQPLTVPNGVNGGESR
jgi:hypothetical protein